MNLNKNTKLIGQHAFLSPSNYHWLEYDEDKLRASYFNKQAARRGDELHAYAQKAIDLRIKQADNSTTLSMYINDALGYRMTAEFPLFYSLDCFGTADAVGCREERGRMTLRISDLKTGVNLAKMEQLKIYAAIFCFEYSFTPDQLHIILRIYQNDEIFELIADPMDIFLVMDRVKTLAALVAYLREENE